jgi:hypothetical protein
MEKEYLPKREDCQESNFNLALHPDSLSHNLRDSRAAIAQAKLNITRLRRCYASARMRGVLDELCNGMDCALSSLERLDFGRPTGGAS